MKIKYEMDETGFCQTPCPYGIEPRIGAAACQKCKYNHGTAKKHVDCRAWEDRFSKLVDEEQKQEEYYATDVTDPELIEKFRRSCEKIILRGARCSFISCLECPGYEDHNRGLGCVANGWRPVIAGADSEEMIENAKAYLKQHPQWIKTGTFCKFWNSEEEPDGTAVGVLYGYYAYIDTSMRHYRKGDPSYFNYARPITTEDLTL